MYVAELSLEPEGTCPLSVIGMLCGLLRIRDECGHGRGRGGGYGCIHVDFSNEDDQELNSFSR